MSQLLTISSATTSMSARIRHLVGWALLFLEVSLVCGAHPLTRTAAERVYLVAATPRPCGSWRSYSAALYAVSPDRKLALVHQLFTESNTFADFADDFHGHLYLAGEHGLFIINENDPTRPDYVPLPDYDDISCWGAVAGGSVAPAVQTCAANDNVIQVPAKPDGKTRVSAGSWSAFRFLQYGGENGGPFQAQPPLAEIAGIDLVMPYSFRPEVVLAKLPSRSAVEPSHRQLVWILASTDRYLVVWILPAYMAGGSVDSSNPRHDEPLEALVLNRKTGQWTELELPTTVTSNSLAPVRMFGDWLVTTVMHWRPGPQGSGSGSPGIGNERSPEAYQPLPDVRDQFSNEFLDLYIPGKIVLQNLKDGRKLALDTGQEDSEVIAIRSDGEMLYRVNDSIYSAEITDRQITGAKLVVSDEGVPEVHWAFWTPEAVSAMGR